MVDNGQNFAIIYDKGLKTTVWLDNVEIKKVPGWFNSFVDPSSDPMATNLKALNSYINFFTIDEEDASEVVGILTLTKKREGLIGGNLQNESEIKKSEFGDEQKLFCIFDRYFRSLLDKNRSLHVIYAGEYWYNLTVN